MKIINPNELQLSDYGSYQMFDAFNENFENKIVKMGKAVMKPGVRVPSEGMNAHVGDEFSYIVNGSLKSGTESITANVSSGDFSFIPKGTKHWCANESNEDCELIWLLVEDK